MAVKRGKSQARRNSGNRGGMPGWAWLVLGVLVTLAAVLLLPRYLKTGDGDGFFRPHPNPDAQPAAEAPDEDEGVVADGAQAATADTAAGDKSADKDGDFDFYTLLPGNEVALSDAQLAAAEKAEAEAEIKAAIADGRLTLKAGKEEGSEVESARKFFLAAHTEALAWLKSKPAAVPTYGLSYGTPPSAADISASADKTAPEEIDLDPAKLSDDEKRLVAMQRGTPKQRAAMARAAIKIHRDRLSQLTH